MRARNISNNVRKARLAVDISQAELARKSGINRPYISNIERGKQTPSVYIGNRLAEELGTTSEYLFPAKNVHIDLQKAHSAKYMQTPPVPPRKEVSE
ncbi:helix-turn-helix transcriptional regulator [Lentilactobacillus buchneri]|uniref:helix-turn-helix transcriptional regulator n=1 Tax=Lentilactobacillus buchneri TaxID=1581 RepID=UPI0009D9AA46|nr:helix-turn-helix transcriptional regulator [Lentilactobacillus buchneri]MCT2901813.1 XRE family transcriptional regulator [Lentilactobacillus buchneri]